MSWTCFMFLFLYMSMQRNQRVWVYKSNNRKWFENLSIHPVPILIFGADDLYQSLYKASITGKIFHAENLSNPKFPNSLTLHSPPTILTLIIHILIRDTRYTLTIVHIPNSCVAVSHYSVLFWASREEGLTIKIRKGRYTSPQPEQTSKQRNKQTTV